MDRFHEAAAGFLTQRGTIQGLQHPQTKGILENRSGLDLFFEINKSINKLHIIHNNPISKLSSCFYEGHYLLIKLNIRKIKTTIGFIFMVVEYMVYPSDLRRVTTTENLGICTLRRSTRPRSGTRDTLRRCGRGTRPYWTWLPATRGSSNPTEVRSPSPNVGYEN